MSDQAFQILIALIAGIPSCAGAVAGYFAYRTSRENAAAILRTNKTVGVMAGKVEEVHAATNGIKDELVKATSVAAHAVGRTEGVKEGIEAAKLVAVETAKVLVEEKAKSRSEGLIEGSAAAS